jgi:hypothetical protein
MVKRKENRMNNRFCCIGMVILAILLVILDLMIESGIPVQAAWVIGDLAGFVLLLLTLREREKGTTQQ